MILSCETRNNSEETNNINFLIGDYYRGKVSLVKMGRHKIVEEKTILDLTELGGKRIIQAEFLTAHMLYVVFETDWVKYTEVMDKVRIYNMPGLNWEDIFEYRSISHIRIIDIEKSGGYFSDYTDRNTLRYLDFNNQTSNVIFIFMDNEEIISINCRFSDKFVVINTYEKKKNLHHYYFIDKQSYEKITEGIGQIYVNNYSEYVVYRNDSQIYLGNDLFNQTEKIEIPVSRGKYFSNAITVDKANFLLCLYSTSPDYIGNLLFGDGHVIYHYDYRLVRIFDNNKPDLKCEKIYKYWNNFDNKIIFDVMPEVSTNSKTR
jgi:prepilin-type processing-associated H-X9-DG protein